MATGPLLSRAVDTLLGLANDETLAGKGKLPTPCDAYDVHGLCEHVLLMMSMGESAACREPWSPDKAGDAGREPWERISALAPGFTKVWADPQVWTGTTQIFRGTHPAQFAGDVMLMEIVIHGWDLARAVGTEFAVDDELVAHVLDTAKQVDGMGGRQHGSFGPEIPVLPDASALDRLLGFTGRDPHWKA
ncbi:TIGR03086 family protein [Microbispora sp. RL4-1S]|uniref:TIGR03086 family protein n=1 Tax=Microbispora oryzae TaxID=2806554 RepID=A0A941AIQ8_9ACTN|nr:TIGR03086 family metal-binding protein [Microbispora oryzae]MBP2705431.1 TIGR03086 family protein [Microbispora oryzae]